MKGARWLGVALLGLALSLVVGGCFEARKYPGPALCASVADCDDGTVCTIDACEDGTCLHEPSGADGPDDQNACTRDQCLDGAESHEPTTKQGNPCGDFGTLSCNTLGQCTGCTTADECGSPEPCRTWRCDAGICAPVTATVGTACAGQGICDGRGYCAQCGDDLQNGGETDVDCGGRCVLASAELRCATGKHCDAGADCATGTCVDGTCVVP